MTNEERDRDVLARTLWGEARGEGRAGMEAVAWIVRNRVFDGNPKSWWGEGYVGVCQARLQFSCWNKNDPNFPYLNGTKAIPSSELARALAVARSVMEGKVPDPTGGATHYYASSMQRPPDWTAVSVRTASIGRHIFFKDVG